MGEKPALMQEFDHVQKIEGKPHRSGKRIRSDSDDLKRMILENQVNYRLFFEVVTDVIISIDTDFVIRDISPSVERELGFKPEELIGVSVNDIPFASDKSRKFAIRNIKKVIGGEKILEAEFELITREGTRIIADITGAPLYRDRKVVACICVARNVTNRREMEERLKESESAYRQLFKHAPAGIFEIDYTTGKFITVNDVIFANLGYSRDELLSMNFFDLFTKESRLHFQERLKKIRAHQTVPDTLEYCVYTKKGRKLWIMINLRYFFNAEGALVKATGVAHDITYRKLAEEKIRENEKWLKTVLENMPITLVALDDKDQVIVWNSECERVTGYRREEVQQYRDLLEVLYPDPEYRAWIDSELSQKRNDYINLELSVTCKGGEVKKIVMSNNSARYPIPGWKFWAVGVDITEIKHAEELLKNMNAELERLVRARTEELNVKARKLEEMNVALKTLLKTAEEFKEDMETRILSNISQVILPYLEKLKNNRSEEDHASYCAILETNIRHITSGFAKRLTTQHLNFTPREIRIATLIKDHKTTKEIAHLLHISESAVVFHRHNIRKKLGMVSNKVNLESYLQSYL